MALSGVSTAQVLISSRTHLDDDAEFIWPDNRLFPKFQEAHRKLQLALQRADIPVISDTSVVLTVPPNPNEGTNLDLSTLAGYPTNMVNPIELKEKLNGQTDDYFVDMEEVDYLPDETLSDYLQYWQWANQTINVLGANTTIQVKIRYIGTLPVPQLNTDSTGVILGELYLSHETAAIALASIGNYGPAKYLSEKSKTYLDQLIAIAVKQLQNLPTKRIPYHHRRGSKGSSLLAGTPNTIMSSPVGWVTITVGSGFSQSFQAELVDLTKGDTYQFILTDSSLNLQQPNLYTPSGQFRIVITQDSVGGHSIVMDPSYKNVDPTTFGTGAGNSTILTFVIRGYQDYVLVDQIDNAVIS